MACRCRSSNYRLECARSLETSPQAMSQASSAPRPTRTARNTNCALSPMARLLSCAGSAPVRRPSDSMASGPILTFVAADTFANVRIKGPLASIRAADIPRPSALSEIHGMAMQWFRKHKPPEIWDQPIEGPIGDIEAAHRIRDICRSAADSAEKVAGFAGNFDSRKKKYEVERYERAARAAME